MRLFIGHKLPLGFYAGLGFGRYGSKPTHVVHADGSQTPVRGPNFFVSVFWIGLLGWFFWTLVYHVVILGQ